MVICQKCTQGNGHTFLRNIKTLEDLAIATRNGRSTCDCISGWSLSGSIGCKNGIGTTKNSNGTNSR